VKEWEEMLYQNNQRTLKSEIPSGVHLSLTVLPIKFTITESMARNAPPEHRMNDRYHPQACTHGAPANQHGMPSKLANWTAITNLHSHKVDINGKINIDLVWAGLKKRSAIE
jgi:hypothetical protein